MKPESVKYKVKVQVLDQAYHQTWEQICIQVEKQVLIKVKNQVYYQISDIIWNRGWAKAEKHVS
jgi:hypothetical protein